MIAGVSVLVEERRRPNPYVGRSGMSGRGDGRAPGQGRGYPRDGPRFDGGGGRGGRGSRGGYNRGGAGSVKPTTTAGN